MKLEARLDSVIGLQRTLLEGARTAWLAIKQAGGSDPLAQQGPLTQLADQERGIVAEAGVIGDLADDEIDTIGKKAQDKRTDEEKVRVVQLKNLDQYLADGRTKIAEARRKLQDLAAEDAVTRAEAALVSLKRAREQLLDPITVLREVARDELETMQETQAVAEAEGGHKVLDTKAPADKPLIPAWMEPTALGERQGGLHDRVEEVRARLAAAVDNADKPMGTGSAAEPPKMSPEQAKMFERLKLALPFVTDASTSMERARAALVDSKLVDAGEAERDAVIALSKAIEQFADLKQTIDLAYETQNQIVGLLSPEAAKLAAADRTHQTKDALAQNLGRMGRIKELLEDEQAKRVKQEEQIDAKAQAGAGSGSGAPDPKQVEAAKQQLAQAKQQLLAAESLRGDADKALGELDAAIKTNKDPQPPAKLADTKLEELRKLFFSVIEHLQELLREQGETRDRTSQANAEDDFTRAPKLPGLVGKQDGHDQMAKAIADSLAKQADEAGKQQGGGQQGQPSPQEMAKNFAAAAAEVRLGETDMTDAKAAISKVQTTTTQSVSLKPAVDSQGKAIEHLQNALKLLQPPPKDQKDQKDQKKDQKQDEAKQDKKQDKQDQGGAGQRARDEDAKRQRDKQKQEKQTDPVDQDW